MAAITVLGPFGIPMTARTQHARQAVAVVTGGQLGKRKQKRQWYTLENGMRVLATEEGYRRLLLRERQARQEAASAPAEAAPPAAVEASKAPQQSQSAELASKSAEIIPLPVEPQSLPEPDPTALRILEGLSLQQAREREYFEERRQQAEADRKAKALALEQEQAEAERLRLEAERVEAEAKRLRAIAEAEDAELEEHMLEMLMEDLAQ